MRPLKIRALSVLLGAFYCLTAGTPVYADDTEIFGTSLTGAGLKPNILFIVDTSGSMDSEVVSVNKPFDPNATYTGACDNSSVYWIQGNTGAPPDCTTTQHFPISQNKCNAATVGMAATGRYVAVKAAMWTPGTSRRPINKWMQILAGVTNQPVECAADAGIHGDGVNTSKLWAQNGNASNLWTSNSANQITWSAGDNADRTYVFYSGNYMNWYHDTTNVSISTRLNIVKQVVQDLANSVDDVNLGLMRYSNNTNGNNDAAAEGGMVTYPVSDIATSRQKIIDTVNSYLADGWTPLSETLYEAGQYLAGRSVDYGLNSMINPTTPFPSVPESRLPTDQSKYMSPIQYSCQKTNIVYLTDGLPTQDNSADDKITALPGFSTLVSSTGCDDTGPGRCLDDMAEYLFKTDLNPNLPGVQNAITYTIGFGPEVTGSTFLEKVAKRGGGIAYSAGDYATLADALTQIVTNVVQQNTTFTSPSVSVNAFNRTQTLDDLYVSVFRPADQLHWPGNVKKYKVTNGQIVDALGNPAIDKGFFKDGTQSFWSPVADGNQVVLGGAASQLPTPDTRNLYTNLGISNSLTDPTNAVVNANANLTDALLGLGAAGLPPHDVLIEYIRGRDTEDENNNGNVLEPRLEMGDPVHAKPAIVIYGGTAASPDVNDAVVYSATNDGYLHAFDAVSGRELWSFIPRDLLASMPQLFLDPIQPNKHYGLDGDIRVFKIDRNANGVVEPSNGDRVLLFFGMRRGGGNYYALDVTRKASPQMLWTLTAGALPALGQTWSTPTVAKVNINGAAYSTGNTTDKFVLIFGGGYEDSQDNEAYNTDLTGNRIYMIDPFNGTLLWSAGGPAGAGVPAPDLSLTKMNNSIPADILVLDTNQDGFADRMYAVDMGGRIWRFDITNGNSRSTLVAGGILASLGAGDMSTPTVAANRRFYSVPDASVVRSRGANPYFAIVVGSGFRGHPLNVNIQDRMYMVKDTAPFAPLTQTQYNTIMSTPSYVTDSQLIDVTDNLSATIATGDKGWKLQLREGAGVWIGEKSLSQATVFNNRIFFTTYIPQTTAPTDPCTLGQGSNRAWAISLLNGGPVENLDGQAATTRDDRHETLQQGGIAPEVVFLFPGSGGTVTNRPLLCLSGVEVLAGVCVNAGAPVRTFWQESGTN